MNQNIFLIGTIVSIILISGCIQKTPNIQSFDNIFDLLNEERKLGTIAVQGIVKTGSQINMDHCSEGFYLIDDTGLIQLRIKNEKGETKMLSDQKFLEKKVEIVGKFDTDQVFCEALICQCDYYILVEAIKILE